MVCPSKLPGAGVNRSFFLSSVAAFATAAPPIKTAVPAVPINLRRPREKIQAVAFVAGKSTRMMERSCCLLMIISDKRRSLVLLHRVWNESQNASPLSSPWVSSHRPGDHNHRGLKEKPKKSTEK